MIERWIGSIYLKYIERFAWLSFPNNMIYALKTIKICFDCCNILSTVVVYIYGENHIDYG